MKALDLFKSMGSKDINSEILEVADYIYTQTTLKPMSKTVFFLSRILLQRKYNLTQDNYLSFINSHNISDDYDFWDIYNNLTENNRKYLLDKIDNIFSSSGTDILGNLFNSLIHGKFEAGEGLGSFLTPDEVVKPTVILANYLMDKYNIEINDSYIGDITGGTGNFLLHFYELHPELSTKNLKIYDQSSLHLSFANINFLLQYNNIPATYWTQDSLTDKSIEVGKYCCLLTNPPFGSNTYTLNYKIDKEYKDIIGIKDKTDPTWLFLIKNLDILSNRGILAIVLPNGVYQSKKFVDLLKLYESKNNCLLSIPFIFDLPVDTFSFAGTVAKTGVLFIMKNIKCDGTSHYNITSIGFRKKGSNKIHTQNKYYDIVDKIIHNKSENMLYDWRKLEYLHNTIQGESNHSIKVSNLSVRVKKYIKEENFNYIHIPVDAVDDYGIIHFNQCLLNKMPKSKPIKCQRGDILVSCLNPRIWRVVKIPNIKNIQWNCSSEFIVLRPKKDSDNLFAILSSNEIKNKALLLAKGTSASRQRINKDDFLNIDVNIQKKKNVDTLKYEQLHQYLYEYINSQSNTQL